MFTWSLAESILSLAIGFAFILLGCSNIRSTVSVNGVVNLLEKELGHEQGSLKPQKPFVKELVNQVGILSSDLFFEQYMQTAHMPTRVVVATTTARRSRAPGNV